MKDFLRTRRAVRAAVDPNEAGLICENSDRWFSAEVIPDSCSGAKLPSTLPALIDRMRDRSITLTDLNHCDSGSRQIPRFGATVVQRLAAPRKRL
jgi:hypothetical protein